MLDQHTLTPDNQQEEWRPVPDFEGRYDVSSLGRVRRVLAAPGARVGYVLKMKRGRGGYPTVGLHGENGVHRTLYVHRLVASAFFGPCPEGKQVNHRDKNRWNPAVTNLEYLTPSENSKHAAENGAWRARGEDHVGAKLTADAVRAIRASTETQRVLAARYGVCQHAIWAVRSGITWRSVRPDAPGGEGEG